MWRRATIGGLGGVVVYAVAAVTRAPAGVSLHEALLQPVSAALADPQAGSLLKGLYRTGSDGSKLYRTDAMFDSARNEECAYHRASDGSLRCMPIDHAERPIYYSDAACTQAFVYVPQPSVGCAAVPPNAYASWYEPAGLCPVPTPEREYWMHVRPYGSLIANPPTIYRLYLGTCQVTQPGAVAVPFSLGPEPPPSAFVDGSDAVDP